MPFYVYIEKALILASELIRPPPVVVVEGQNSELPGSIQGP